MYNFKSLNQYYLAARNAIVYIVECPIKCDTDDCMKYFGGKQIIDGKIKLVIGVERFATARQFPGDLLGLAVCE